MVRADVRVLYTAFLLSGKSTDTLNWEGIQVSEHDSYAFVTDAVGKSEVSSDFASGVTSKTAVGCSLGISIHFWICEYRETLQTLYICFAEADFTHTMQVRRVICPSAAYIPEISVTSF
jgi:hypothetical protein